MRFRRHLLTVVLGIGLSGCQGTGAQTESGSPALAHSRVTRLENHQPRGRLSAAGRSGPWARTRFCSARPRPSPIRAPR